MKIKNLLTLAAALLLCGTVAVGCGPASSSSEPESSTPESSEPESSEPTSSEPVSSEEVVDPNALIKDAADYVWQMYRSKDGKEITSSFDVVKKVSVGKEIVSVSWAIDVEGAEEGFEVRSKDDNFATIYVGQGDYLVTEDSTVKLVPTFTYGEVSKTLAQIFAEDATKHAIDFTTPKKLLVGHAVTIQANEYGLTDTASTITKTFKAKSIKNEEVDVTIELKNLYYNYSAVYFGKGVNNDLFTISAPEGYLVTKIELESYGKYDNFKFYAGADTTGAELAKPYETNAKGNNLYTVTANSNKVTIDNPTTNNCSFYGITIFVQRKSMLTPVSLLGFAGANVNYNGSNTKTTTVNGLEISYNEVGCYLNKNDATKNDGLQFRINKDNGNTSTIWTSKAVESGIENVDMKIAATKSAYDNKDAIKFEFSNNADFSDAEVIMLSTVKTSKEYTVTPSVDTYKYVRITHMLTFTGYWDSIDIVY